MSRVKFLFCKGRYHRKVTWHGRKVLMEPICGVPKIQQKRINFPTFVGGERVKLFPLYELFFEGISYRILLMSRIQDCHWESILYKFSWRKQRKHLSAKFRKLLNFHLPSVTQRRRYLYFSCVAIIAPIVDTRQHTVCQVKVFGGR